MSRSRYAQVPQETAEEEMYAAFDNDEEDDALDNESHQPSQPLLSSHRREASWHPLDSSSTDNINNSLDNALTHSTPALTRHTSSRSVAQAGTYDFEYDYAMLPPPGSPPRPSQLALPNAYGNTNGLLPTSPPLASAPTPSFLRRAFGAILPTHYARDRRGGGLGNDGVFGNVVAKPAGPGASGGGNDPEGPYMIPEDAQKDAPPVCVLFTRFRINSGSPLRSWHYIISRTQPRRLTLYLHIGKTPSWRQTDHLMAIW